jgi:hypothetical protein
MLERLHASEPNGTIPHPLSPTANRKTGGIAQERGLRTKDRRLGVDAREIPSSDRDPFTLSNFYDVAPYIDTCKWRVIAYFKVSSVL